MDNTYFNKALANFTNDVAYGGAVRKLVGQGCTVKEIKAKIDYPVSESKIAEMVWKYFIDNGIIIIIYCIIILNICGTSTQQSNSE